jgi:hypothetical protein
MTSMISVVVPACIVRMANFQMDTAAKFEKLNRELDRVATILDRADVGVLQQRRTVARTVRLETVPNGGAPAASGTSSAYGQASARKAPSSDSQC